MDMKALTRCALLTVALAAVAGQASGGEDDSHDGPRPHHRGYKVGGGVVVLIVIGAVAASMVVFGDLRRRRVNRKGPAPLPPPPLPEGSEWDTEGSEDITADQPSLPSPRQRKAKRGEGANH